MPTLANTQPLPRAAPFSVPEDCTPKNPVATTLDYVQTVERTLVRHSETLGRELNSLPWYRFRRASNIERTLRTYRQMLEYLYEIEDRLHGKQP